MRKEIDDSQVQMEYFIQGLTSFATFITFSLSIILSGYLTLLCILSMASVSKIGNYVNAHLDTNVKNGNPR